MPGEGQLEMPHIQLVGNQWLQLENHHGIIAYEAQEVQISFNGGVLVVSGQELMIERVDREGICLTGKIASLSFGQ